MKDKLANYIKNNVCLRKSNISMLVLSAFYIGLTLFSLYYSMQGYIFYPNNRERLLKLFMFCILLLAFMIISPDKETHRISLFTIICLSVLSVSTGIFVTRLIYVHLEYEAVFTIIVSILALSVSVASSFGIFKTYPATDFFNTSKGKIVALIPQVLNVIIVLFLIGYLFYTPIFKESYSEPQSFATSYSPKKTYMARTEKDYQYDGSVNYYIRIYKNQEDKEYFFGKFDYCAPAFVEFSIENCDNMNYVWLSEESFIAQGETYSFDAE